MKNPPIVPLPTGTVIVTEANLNNPPTGAKPKGRRPNRTGVVQGLVANSDGSVYHVTMLDGSRATYGYWEINPKTYLSVEEKIAEGAYHVPRNTRRTAAGAKLVAATHREFRDDLVVFLGVGIHPKGETLVDLAWKLTPSVSVDGDEKDLAKVVETAKALLPLIQ